MTPPRDGGRSSDTDLIAPVVALRRRATAGEGESAGAPPPAGEYSLFDQPAPRLTNRDMWDGPRTTCTNPAQHRRSSSPPPASRPTPPARRHRPAAPRVLAVAGVLASRGRRGRRLSLSGPRARTARRSSARAATASPHRTHHPEPAAVPPLQAAPRPPQPGRGRRASAPRGASVRERSPATGPRARRDPAPAPRPSRRAARPRTLRRRRRTIERPAPRAIRPARVPLRARRRLPTRTGACRATSRAELPTEEMS